MSLIHCSSVDNVTWIEPFGELEANGAHIFRLQLSSSASSIAKAKSVLSKDEISRAGKYYNRVDKERFILSRAVLRVILSHYIGIAAPHLVFTIGVNKKPYLPRAGRIQYNVSHAGDWAVVAISDQPVGVDVEFVDPGYNYRSVLDLCFSGDEIIHINSAANSLSTFYSLWTRKEALVKATAKGMDDNFRHVPSLDGDHTAKAAIIDSESDWNTVSLPLAERHIASIAYSPSIQNVTYFEAADLLKNIVL